MLQLIVPALNEEQRLPRTLRALRAYVADQTRIPGRVEVLVVDNGSTDATAQVARDADSPLLPVRVLTCTERGKGAAVRAGVLASDAALVGFMDADGATDLAALDEAWRWVALGADLAVGSRSIDGSVTMARHSRVRDLGARLYRTLAGRIVTGIGDTQCGFKLMNGDHARSLFAEMSTVGFSFDVELLARAQRAGLSIHEFPVHWTDVPGSTFDPARHGAASFRDLAGIAWRLRAGARATAATGHVVPLHPTALRPTALGDLVEPALEGR